GVAAGRCVVTGDAHPLLHRRRTLNMLTHIYFALRRRMSLIRGNAMCVSKPDARLTLTLVSGSYVTACLLPKERLQQVRPPGRQQRTRRTREEHLADVAPRSNPGCAAV